MSDSNLWRCFKLDLFFNLKFLQLTVMFTSDPFVGDPILKID
jgi:hypothetical protein